MLTRVHFRYLIVVGALAIALLTACGGGGRNQRIFAGGGGNTGAGGSGNGGVIGDGTGGNAGLPGPSDPSDGGSPPPDNGNTETTPQIYVADTGNNRVVRVDGMSGSNPVTFGTQGSGVGQFTEPRGIALDKQGRIYIADNGNHRVVRIDDMQGTNWTTLPVADFPSIDYYGKPGLWGLAVDGQGRIYSFLFAGAVFTIERAEDMSGANRVYFGPSSEPNTVFPLGLGLDTQGRIYYAGMHLMIGQSQAGEAAFLSRMDDIDGSNRVQYFMAGSFDDAPGITIDSQGRIYFVEGDSVIRIDDMNGANRTILKTSERLLGTKFTVDVQGRIYIVDRIRNAIVCYNDMSGTQRTVLGRFGANERFSEPLAIAVR